MSALIEAKNLEKDYASGGGTVKAVCGLDFAVARGESVAINGKSGSGKTTLLNMLGALETPTCGELFFEGEPYTRAAAGNRGAKLRRKMGFVFQSHNLLDGFTALENAAMPGLISGLSKTRSLDRAREMLALVELGDITGRFPDELSAGQRQRVAIARALVCGPDVIFADEPTGNLDPKTSDTVARVMLSAKDKTGAALVVATHSGGLSRMLDRTVVVNGGRIADV